MTTLPLRILVHSLLATVLFPIAAPAQGDTARGMARVMTPREMEESGISRLTLLERQHLDGWLLRYTAEIARRLRSRDTTIASQNERNDRASSFGRREVAAGRRQFARPSIPGLVSLERTLASGDYVELSDGTIWSIYLIDRPAAVSWRAGDLIVVRQSGLGYGDYDHILTNNSDGSRAFARLGGPPRDIDQPR